MGFMELAARRFSARKFEDRPIEREKLSEILKAGSLAPTACNNQPQRIKLITAQEDLKKLDECTPCRFNAPAALIVCYDKNVCWKRKYDGANSGEVDAGIVTTHMMLSACDQGLGTCWVMYFDPEKVIRLFELSENIIPAAILPIGYITEDCEPADLHSIRKPIEEILL